jgi:hypothetical protein
MEGMPTVRRRLVIGERLLVRVAGRESPHMETIAGYGPHGAMLRGNGMAPWRGSLLAEVDGDGQPVRLVLSPEAEASQEALAREAAQPPEPCECPRRAAKDPEFYAALERLSTQVWECYSDMHKAAEAETGATLSQAASLQWCKRHGVAIPEASPAARRRGKVRNETAKPTEDKDVETVSQVRKATSRHEAFYGLLERVLGEKRHAAFADAYREVAGMAPAGAAVPHITGAMAYCKRHGWPLPLMSKADQLARLREINARAKAEATEAGAPPPAPPTGQGPLDSPVLRPARRGPQNGQPVSGAASAPETMGLPGAAVPGKACDDGDVEMVAEVLEDVARDLRGVSRLQRLASALHAVIAIHDRANAGAVPRRGSDVGTSPLLGIPGFPND